MRAVVCGVVCFCGILPAFSQGEIGFSNGPGQELTNGVTGLPLPVSNQFVIGLYYAPTGTTDEAAFQLIRTTGIIPIPGRFTGGTVVVPASTRPGTAAEFQVRAWSAGYPDYESARSSMQPNVLIGQSVIFSEITANPAIPEAVGNLRGMNAFRLYPVPEPSALHLSLLGLLLFWFVKRRASQDSRS